MISRMTMGRPQKRYDHRLRELVQRTGDLTDTHTLLWWLDGDRRLSRPARTAIADDRNVVLVSAASALEIATK